MCIRDSILQRAYQQYGQAEYQRLATISVAHLYNLRQQPRYRERRLNYVKTKPTAVTIGERRRHDPQGQPGYLRVDTVHQGYGYIDAVHAERLQQFYSAHFNPYLNYHRPCSQAEVEVDAKGRKRCFYRRYQTPLETLLALPEPAQYLRPGLTVAVLQRIAAAVSDTEAAQRMQQAKRKLFEQLRPAGFGEK